MRLLPDREKIGIFCGGRRTVAELIEPGRYRCLRCGNVIRGVSGLEAETGKRRPGVAK